MAVEFVGKVTIELLNKTREEWGKIIDSNPLNVSQAYYAAGLDYCQQIIETNVQYSSSGAGCVCAVTKDNETLGLIVVTHAPKNSKTPNLKMSNMYVRPDLNLADQEPNYRELAWVAATAIVGCLDLTYEQFPAEELKIYTQFPLDADFLTVVTTVIFGQVHYAEHYTVTGHTNWLVVKKNGKEAPRVTFAE